MDDKKRTAPRARTQNSGPKKHCANETGLYIGV